MRRTLVLALAVAAGAVAIPAPALAAPVTISSGSLSASVDSAFPRVISYTLGGSTLHGQEDTLSQVVLNGTAYTPTITSTVSSTKVDYAMSFSTGAIVNATISVSGTAVEFKVTSASSGVMSLAIPNHNLVSVRSTQTGAALATANMHTATTGTGDTFTSITGTTAVNASPVGVMYAIANTAQLAAAISTNSYYDSPSGGNANENGRIRKQVVDKGTYRRAGLWSGDWTVKANGATEQEPLPFAKIVITADRNADSAVDWQDGAIAFRDIMTNPLGWQETKDRVVQRIPFNFASQATHPFLRTLDETKRVALATDNLGQFVLLKGYASEGHDSAHPDYGGNMNTRAGGLTDLNTLVNQGSAYNADFGVHMQATEAYPVAKTFSDTLVDESSKGWDWLDQSYYIDRRFDANSGNRLNRLQQLKNEVPNLDFLYVDVWYGDGWETRKFAREINGLGYQVTTEFPDKFEENTLWNHWATDVNYGGSDYKGINSQIARFIRNHQRDDWIARHPVLGGAEITAYEGWQGKKDFTAFVNTTFGVNVPTKFLQHQTISRWSGNTITFTGGVTASVSGSTRTITRDGRTVLSGNAYLLPWDNDAKLYHWNDGGGPSTFGVPTSWTATTAKLYRLTDTGRVFVSDLNVSGGQVTINATAKTPYVVYPATAPAHSSPNWGEGGPVKNPGFFGGTNDWTVSGAASVTRNALGQSQLVMGSGAASVTQTVTGLTPGTYAASVYVSTSSGRRATLTAGGQSAYTTNSPYTNNVGGDEKNGSPMQRMRVLFDVPSGQSAAVLSLQADAGTAAVTFDDVRVVKTVRSPQGTHMFFEDFENVDQGWYPFVVGNAGGSATDPRTHLAQIHAPYTQKGWNGKLIDDVIAGQQSLKAHEERQGLIYRTLPQTLRFTPGRQYRVTFSYQQSVGGDYGFVLGAGASEVSTDSLAQAHTTTTFTKTFTAGTDAWIGMKKLTPETSNQDRDLIIDDLAVDDLGGGTPVGNRLPQSQMSIRAVDSQETVGENGAAANVLDGNSATIWHTQWYNSTAPLPHTLDLDLGGTYQVTNLYYLPRQNSANGRIGQYEVYVSADGTNWGTAVASGTWPSSTAEQTVTFAAKTGRYVRLKALSEVGGNAWSSAAEINVGVQSRLPQSSMTVTFASSADDASGGQAANVLDGDPATLWHTAWSTVDPDPVHPHEIRIDLGGTHAVNCVYALPRQTGTNGRIAGYEVYVSTDGTTWGAAVATGTWANSATEQSACFTAKTGRYVRLRALSEVNGGAWTSLAELNVSAA